MNTNSAHSEYVSLIREAFAGVLKAEQSRRGVTVEELERRSGVSKSTLLHFRRGTRSPSVDQLTAIAFGLGMDSADLLAEATKQARKGLPPTATEQQILDANREHLDRIKKIFPLDSGE